MAKKQVVVMHGGDSFKTYEDYLNSLKTWEVRPEKFKTRYDWKISLQSVLGDDFEVFNPQMPNKYDAKYKEWKIWFERMFPFLNDDVVLIGHSLGGMFLAKYLAENDFPKKIKSLHLVAPPHNNTADCEDFRLPDSLSNIEKQAKNIFLYQSKDDPIVPYSELAVFEKQLPSAKSQVFEDRGHFNQDEFPELIGDIKSHAKC
ncbi:MAG: alpha/beta fold hydrolase [Patescibacteria group bacterium]|jgi:hypothetical protein